MLVIIFVKPVFQYRLYASDKFDVPYVFRLKYQNNLEDENNLI